MHHILSRRDNSEVDIVKVARAISSGNDQSSNVRKALSIGDGGDDF